MDQKDLAVAFGLCAGAGLSTTIGVRNSHQGYGCTLARETLLTSPSPSLTHAQAAFVFVPQFQNNAALAGSLAFAAGVMIYVSMVESKCSSVVVAAFFAGASINHFVHCT
jgi:hypothetical protein